MGVFFLNTVYNWTVKQNVVECEHIKNVFSSGGCGWRRAAGVVSVAETEDGEA